MQGCYLASFTFLSLCLSHHLFSLWPPPFLSPPSPPCPPGQSKWKKTPESHVNSLPTRNHPLRQCLQPADRKHLHIQVSPLPNSSGRWLMLFTPLCVPDSAGRLRLWNTFTLKSSLSLAIKQKLLFLCCSHPSLEKCKCKEVWCS